jgi:alpha-L-arabinofuranosidase
VKNRNNLECAIAEAAYLTGLERNADVVTMASYAPLFAHADAWQWTPDLIWVNNLQVIGTPSYYVQQLFCRNRGDRVLPTKIKAAPGATGPRCFASATRETATGDVILKLVNAGGTAVDADILLSGLSQFGARGRATVLTGPSAAAVNSFEHPRNVAPLEAALKSLSSRLVQSLPAHSLTVLRLPVK